MSAENQNQERLEFLKMEIAEAIELYKHHQELFLKWIGLYGATITALSVYLFHAEVTLYGRRLIPLLIAFGSLPVAVGCLGMFYWTRQLETWVKRMSDELGVSSAPYFGGKHLNLIMGIVLFGAFLLSFFVLMQWESIFKANQ
jgi:hypothetical protein